MPRPFDVKRVFKRGSDQGSASPMTWETRLAHVGHLIDTQGYVADLAIVVADTNAIASGILMRSGLYHGGWSHWTLVVETDPDQLHQAVRRSQAADGVAADGVAADDAARLWLARLGAVGALLDRHPLPLTDLCLLEVGDGFVVEALTETRTDATSTWLPASLEMTAEEVASTIEMRRARGGRPG